MSVLIVDGDGNTTISHFSISKLNRMQMEHRILSIFGEGELTVKEIVKRTGLPFSSLRNHLYRMRNEGSLSARYERVENYNLVYYKVVR